MTTHEVVTLSPAEIRLVVEVVTFAHRCGTTCAAEVERRIGSYERSAAEDAAYLAAYPAGGAPLQRMREERIRRATRNAEQLRVLRGRFRSWQP